MTAALVNLATRLDPALDGHSERCRALVRGVRCTSAARWRFVLDDLTTLDVCRIHLRKGERRGTLDVEWRAMEQMQLGGAVST